MTDPIMWAGGEHVFAFRMGDYRALQDKTGRGPEEILMRLANRTWFIDEAVETVRFGLIGGGMDRDEARRIIGVVADAHPIVEFRIAAFDALSRALYPQEAGEPEKQMAAESLPVDGTSPPSTAPGS